MDGGCTKYSSFTPAARVHGLTGVCGLIIKALVEALNKFK